MDKKDKIEKILQVMETGSINPQYGSISIYNDGPGGSRQITFGKMQTTESGNLKELIQDYVDNSGRFGDDFRPYLKDIGKKNLSNDAHFIQLLRESANDSVMQRTQDKFFDKVYWDKAYKFFVDNGFTQPLSMLVIFDSYIHSGSILKFLRNAFDEVPPASGGDEKKWITAYTTERNRWLSNHTNKLIRNSSYRTRDYLREIKNGNWDLTKPVVCNGVVVD